MTTVAADQTGAAVLVRTADSRLYILSDPDLLQHPGLARPGHGHAGEPACCWASARAPVRWRFDVSSMA